MKHIIIEQQTWTHESLTPTCCTLHS